MTRGKTMLAAIAFCLLAQTVSADLLPTYRDEAEEESARLGVVSLSGTTANYTINLTGIILLGLALSAAVTLWAYLHSLFDKKYGSFGGGYSSGGYSEGYGGSSYKLSSSGSVANYTINLTGVILLGLGVAAATMFWIHLANVGSNKGSYYKRSLDDDAASTVPVVLANMHKKFEEAAVEEMVCRQRVMCEASNQKHNNFSHNTFGYAVNAFFRIVEEDEELKKQLEGDKRGSKYLQAWTEGKRGKSCKAAYEKCSMASSRINTLLQSE